MVHNKPGEFGPHILVLTASDNPGGPESVLAGAAARELATAGGDVTQLSLYDYPLPMFGNGPGAALVPPTAHAIAGQIDRNQCLLLVCGEYNASIPVIVKNMIDWVALVRPGYHAGQSAFSQPKIVLATLTGDKTGQSAIGDHLRTVLEAAGANNIAGTFIFRAAEIATDHQGHLADRTVSVRLRTLSDTLLRDKPTVHSG